MSSDMNVGDAIEFLALHAATVWARNHQLPMDSTEVVQIRRWIAMSIEVQMSDPDTEQACEIIAKGARVRLRHTVDGFPEGATGVVTEDTDHVLIVRLDGKLAGDDPSNHELYYERPGDMGKEFQDLEVIL